MASLLFCVDTGSKGNLPLPLISGRFDDQVITERQQSAQDLLNFVGQRHYLVNSPVFKQFLEVMKYINKTRRINICPVFKVISN